MGHKKLKRKYLNILLIPDDEGSPRRLRLRYSILQLGIAVAIVLFVMILVGIITYGQLLQKALENQSLRNENNILRQQLQKINELEAELKQLKSYGEKVQNSLSGYIKLTEGSQGEEASIDSDALQTRPIFSIFKSIPVKPPVVGFISQHYKEDVHNGIDIAAPEGTPIVAPASGQVLFSGWTVNGGNTIIIGHDFGYYSYYKHNLRNLVRVNQWVEQGEVIAYLGNSGQKSYGPHLHFEIWKNSRPIDPRILIAEYNVNNF